MLSDVNVTEDKFKIQLRNSTQIDSVIVTALLNFLKGNINKIVDKLITGFNGKLHDLAQQPCEVLFKLPLSEQLFLASLNTLAAPNFPFNRSSLMNMTLNMAIQNTATNQSYVESEND